MTRARAFANLTKTLGLEVSDEFLFDKRKLTRDNYFMLLNKTAQMFEYENLPPTIPRIALEFLLQIEGSAVIWKPPERYKPRGDGLSFNYESLVTNSDLPKIYAFSATVADAPDPYGEPYKVIVTNPGFIPSISEELVLNKDCVLIRNDTYMRGIDFLHRKYAYLLTEAEVSLRSTLICLRDQMTFIAKTENQRAAVAKYIQDRESGVPGSILAKDMGSPLEVVQADGRTNSVELAVNGRQAIYAAWYNEVGLNPSFSLKREYTSAQEIGENNSLLQPTIDDMLYCRERACENINAMFGTNISVHKSSSWQFKEKELENALDMEEAQIDSLVTNDEEKEGSSDGELRERGDDGA